MIKEIQDMKTWEEAHRWLAKHGWGMEQIREQKELWDTANSIPTVVVAKEKPVIATKETPKQSVTKPVIKEK